MKRILPLLVLTLLGAVANVSTLRAEEEGFTPLFNGKDLDGWIGAVNGYFVEDGAIVCNPKKGGNLYYGKEFDNFDLKFEFKLEPGANNGLAIRSPVEGNSAYNGIELQVLDTEDERYKGIKPYQAHGSVYGVVPAKRGFLKPVGEWNTQEVIADGYHIKVILNGETIVDANIEEASKDGTLDGQKHPGLLNKKGHIGFLGHGTKVEFRNIRIKSLDK
ncbi:DUF1080 domain-containing protein [Blastopirellula sp. JC732]|uniref:DUF1080 domain-containing protein n=1 Tax=Blastopirellula sediminis TaxID=2894196 RepID=A0A9X1MHY8_9BACT|nr:DUF1080 domain-containing protein [Blastopirellula sediminis]MCC9607754.1 DUF1080 domain-containing protein [Blastopirellula sediminis]MCC9627453.1 DUF1080 domain-containing protein [Blastopirellula sediminis]